MNNRVKNIFKNIDEDLDAIIIKNSTEPFIDINFFYFTGLNKGLFEESVAILYPNGDIDLIVSKLEKESAKKSKSKVKIYNNYNELKNFLKNHSKNVDNIGINSSFLSHKDFLFLNNIFTKSKILDVAKNIEESRYVKDKSEIELIKKSCKIVDKIVKKIPEFLKKGIAEYEIAAEIDYLMQRYGADKPAFETISSFGKNSAEPHYTHGNKSLENGEFALFDFGACCDKYNSDITRTFVLGKSVSRHKKIYETVLEAQNKGLDIIKEGVAAESIHEKVYDFINKTEFKNKFIHSTGHSLGILVHDGVGFSSGNKIKLKENMVFTIEPGIYLPGFGGVRIEDDILVKKEGFELLTKSNKEFIEI